MLSIFPLRQFIPSILIQYASQLKVTHAQLYCWSVSLSYYNNKHTIWSLEKRTWHIRFIIALLKKTVQHKKLKEICQSISSSNERLILTYVDDDELDKDEDLFVEIRSVNVVKRVESFVVVVDVDTVVIAVNCGEGDDNNNVSFSTSSFNEDENDGVKCVVVLLVKDFLLSCRWR